jgi:cell filamentation protein, protein adenylyltransferase
LVHKNTYMPHFSPDKPFDNLPILPPTANIETIGILKAVTKARAALAEMKGVGTIIPNPAMLINSLTLREAKASSEIENILTTQDELYVAMATEIKNIDPQIKEVLNYKRALWYGYNRLNERGIITTNDICKIQEELLENSAGIRTQPGTVLKNSKTGKTIYTPPSGENIIREKLKNLEQYINEDEDEIDPLIKMAVIHYQFESIHPFYDGNGRAGRILNVLYLVYRDLLDIPILYLSSYIIESKREYYRLLNEIPKTNDWESWIIYLIKGIEETAITMTRQIKAIKNLLDETIEKVKEEAPKIYSKELVETLFEQPYCKVAFIVKNNIAERKAAMRYLKELEYIGILKSMKRGKQQLFLNSRLYELLAENF